jgi:hypothetical protein
MKYFLSPLFKRLFKKLDFQKKALTLLLIPDFTLPFSSSTALITANLEQQLFS